MHHFAPAMKAFVHKTAEVSKQAKIGDGTFIWNEAKVREGAEIGRLCRIGKSVYVDKNVIIGDGCKIQNFATIYDGVVIGSQVFIGPHVCFTNDIRPRAASTDWRILHTKVDDGASIGANATIVCGVRIGKYAMVGAGAVVTKDVPRNGLVVGNPAVIIGYVCSKGHDLDKSHYCRVCDEKVRVPHTRKKKSG